LTGKPSADEVDGLEFISLDLSNVSIPYHLRPVLLQYLLAERVELDLPDYLHASAFEAQF